MFGYERTQNSRAGHGGQSIDGSMVLPDPAGCSLLEANDSNGVSRVIGGRECRYNAVQGRSG